MWSAEECPGDTHVTIKILLFLLVKLCLKTKVNLEALYGTCESPFEYALMHSFSDNKLLLISAPSKRLYLSFDIQSYALSEPAKSTNTSFPIGWSFSNITILQMAWDLEDP